MSNANLTGVKVRMSRRRQKLTQQELADKAEITKPHVSMIESGKRTPSLDVLNRLAKALKVKPGELL